MAQNEKTKIRRPDGETGVWVSFPDATVLKVDAYKGSGVEYYYRLTILGESEPKKYYGSYNFHCTFQHAFDTLKAQGHPLANIEMHVRKLPIDGGKKKWVLTTQQQQLADSSNTYQLSQDALAREKDETSQEGAVPGTQQPPPPGTDLAPPPPGQQPAQPQAPPQQPQQANGKAPASKSGWKPYPGDELLRAFYDDPKQTTPTAYLWMAAHALRCMKLAEAVMLSDELLREYSSEDVRAMAIHMNISMFRFPATGKMVDDVTEAIEAHAERMVETKAPTPEEPPDMHPQDPEGPGHTEPPTDLPGPQPEPAHPQSTGDDELPF